MLAVCDLERFSNYLKRMLTKRIMNWKIPPIMPTGPNKEKRPASAIARAVMVAQIATGEKEDDKDIFSGRTRSGKAGGKARAEKLTAKERSDIAKKAAKLSLIHI